MSCARSPGYSTPTMWQQGSGSSPAGSNRTWSTHPLNPPCGSLRTDQPKCAPRRTAGPGMSRSQYCRSRARRGLAGWRRVGDAQASALFGDSGTLGRPLRVRSVHKTDSAVPGLSGGGGELQDEALLHQQPQVGLDVLVPPRTSVAGFAVHRGQVSVQLGLGHPVRA